MENKLDDSYRVASVGFDVSVADQRAAVLLRDTPRDCF